jgi:hypothetical protein
MRASVTIGLAATTKIVLADYRKYLSLSLAIEATPKHSVTKPF